MKKPKGINTAKKGWKKERECRKLLESQGYRVVFKSIRWKWGTLDFAGLFDTVAVKIIDKHPEWLFVSNKHASDGKTHLQHQVQLRVFKDQLSLSFMNFELWLWHAPRYRGRGINKAWQEAKWQVISI